MTPAELARRLERSFGVLACWLARRGPTHQTLRATIDWSFQLLAEPEQAAAVPAGRVRRRLHPGSRRDGLRRRRY
jgi:predicted ATPase